MFKKVTYVADFETIERDGVEEVWLWDVCNAVSKEHTTGTELADFWKHVDALKCTCTIYFHNLKFDGSFIMDYLLKNGYSYKDVKIKNMHKNEMTCLITDLGQYFSISYKNKCGKIVNLWDSAKLIPLTVRKMAEDFDLQIKKGKIDYKKPRPHGYVPTSEEIAYVHNDTEIVADVLSVFYEEGYDSMTLSSCAFSENKKLMGTQFKQYFGWWETHGCDNIDKFITYKEDECEDIRENTLDSYMRRAYRGGFCGVNPRYAGKTIKKPVYYYDVNSKYPYEMAKSPMPVGKPVPYEGKYVYDQDHPLYIQRIRVDCALKDGGIACILLKNKGVGNEYLHDSNGIIPLTLTNLDLELLSKNYEIYHIEYLDGFKFKAKTGVFAKYVDKFMKMKIKADKDGNTGIRQIAKLFLNSLYGKFGQNPKRRKKIPKIEDDRLKFERGPETLSDKCNYLPVAIYVCAWGRYHIIHDIMEIERRCPGSWVYTDTDSILSLILMDASLVDDAELGLYKVERIFKKSRYLGPKTYWGITSSNKIVCKACGCNSQALKKLPIGKFNYDQDIRGGKVYLKTVAGGKRLVTKEFKIRQRI